ncbi:Class III Peroxidase [Chara braunii]|uniref:Class III Peroxidase n=1 Tax=Chara braunii TaxID=69332 RepID=A0A388LJ61_CHABU|nr:Class III Peroxidase [Chara braunii]|eukprot:GBG82262.1 Class III Peroxidase [Chara braunii]
MFTEPRSRTAGDGKRQTRRRVASILTVESSAGNWTRARVMMHSPASLRSSAMAVAATATSNSRAFWVNTLRLRDMWIILWVCVPCFRPLPAGCTVALGIADVHHHGDGSSAPHSKTMMGMAKPHALAVHRAALLNFPPPPPPPPAPTPSSIRSAPVIATTATTITTVTTTTTVVSCSRKLAVGTAATLGRLDTSLYSPSRERCLRRAIQRYATLQFRDRTRRMAPILLRLAFHDCVTRRSGGRKGGGCDGSILLDSELSAEANDGLVGTTQVIDDIRRRSGRACGGVVPTRADTIAAAGIAAISAMGGPDGSAYGFRLGRRDVNATANMGGGAGDPLTLPDADEAVPITLDKVRQTGLSDEEVVVLTLLAHSVGVAHCDHLVRRVGSNCKAPADPSLTPQHACFLAKACESGNRTEVQFERRTPFKLDDLHLALIYSQQANLRFDQSMKTHPRTAAILLKYCKLSPACRKAAGLKPPPSSGGSGPSGQGSSLLRTNFIRAYVKMTLVGINTDGN